MIVSSKGSTTDSRLIERRDAMRSAVADLDGRDALHLDFYDRTRMATWVREYTGEILWLRNRIGRPLPGWQPYGNWSRAPGGADGEYLSDDTARLRDQTHPQNGPLTISDGIARLRSLLSVPGGIVRLTGLSGTGKTRLLEALFDPGIGKQPLDPVQAVYVHIGHDAPQPNARQLANQLIRRRIAEFSDGNARIAILSAQHVGPDTNLADLGDEGHFERLFHPHKQVDDHLLRAAEALALVYSFDGETWKGDGAELPFLAGLVGLDVNAVHRAVGKLKWRDIVQARGRWRAILPQPLANWLAKRALENLPAREVADAFWRCGNPRLLQSFAHRLSYLHDSEEAKQIAAAWLEPGGPLSDLREMAQSSKALWTCGSIW